MFNIKYSKKVCFLLLGIKHTFDSPLKILHSDFSKEIICRINLYKNDHKYNKFMNRHKNLF